MKLVHVVNRHGRTYVFGKFRHPPIFVSGDIYDAGFIEAERYKEQVDW